MSYSSWSLKVSAGWLGTALLAVGLSAAAAVASADVPLYCGSLAHRFGPADYNDPKDRAQHLEVVERVHFTSDVRNLRRGATGNLAPDLDYVLNFFPNHHEALDAMSRLAIRERRPQALHSQWSVECWFDRAVRFRPDDGMVWMVWGMHHYRLDENEAALEKMLRAAKLTPFRAEIHYNLGLIQARIGDYSAAQHSARKAYRMGFPLPGLRNILERSGHPLGD